ncbi:hypothetical protein [Vibrio atlanticus]|uniref:hypothetical protein n=1 Tax=Vibrio atlanticus TaxID=693153 RepID=UPI003554676B
MNQSKRNHATYTTPTLLSREAIQKDIQALDAGDLLTDNMEKEFERLKNMGANDLMKKAASMMMTGKMSLAGLGLPENFFEQYEQLAKINKVTRMKYRAVLDANVQALDSVEEVAEHE